MSDYRFPTPRPVELKVTIPAGDIDLETVDGDESVIELDGDERLVEQTTVEQRGDTIVVDFHGKRGLLGINISIGDFSFGAGRLRVRAKVPHSSVAKLASASADTRVRGTLASIETKTASGDLRVHGEIEGAAIVKTVSGDATLERIGGDLRVQSVSGDVKVERVGGSVVAKSVSGDLRVEAMTQGHAEVTSVSGDVQIGIAVGSGVDVDANSVSGDLSSEVALADRPDEAGAGPMVVVRGKTVSGDFRVFRAA
ncbi:MAG TPA: DUF4097 family beta strand repeat-containing protein [Gaiellaceae bacterium]|nr:DUF4097 family beta strand repeat-containing protein [Gaiellaceae bacterium]